jgi:hypothetical protein
MGLYKKYYSREITKELLKLAERDGWRKLFFTNKIKLQVIIYLILNFSFIELYNKPIVY